MLVDVCDVAAMHWSAMERQEAAGQRFACDREFMSLQEISHVLAQHFPERADKMPKKILPNIAIRLAQYFQPAPAAVMTDIGIERRFSNTKSREISGQSYRSGHEAIIAISESVMI